jgi:hypothetical protein
MCNEINISPRRSPLGRTVTSVGRRGRIRATVGDDDGDDAGVSEGL